MASICTCGRYVGNAPVCTFCGAPNSAGRSRSTFPDLSAPDAYGLDDEPRLGDYDPLIDPASHDSGHEGVLPQTDPRSGPRPAWSAVRGTAIEGELRPMRSAGGVGLLRLTFLLLTALVVATRWGPVVEAVTEGLFSLLLMVAVPLVIVVVLLSLMGRFLPVGGCLTSIFTMSRVSTMTGTGRSRPAGWSLVLETASGPVPCEVVADVDLDEGARLVVHGPVLRGVKHAWLVQGLPPQSFSRVGRGVVPTFLGGLALLGLALALATSV